MWLVHKQLCFSLINLYSCTWTVKLDTCNRIVKATNHSQSFQPNPLIIELLPIAIATTTYSEKNCGISRIEEFFTQTMSLPDILILIVFVVFRKLYRLWLIGNKTSCRPFLSVITLVIDKSNFSLAIVRFCQSLVWLQTTLGPITITNKVNYPISAKKKITIVNSVTLSSNDIK